MTADRKRNQPPNALVSERVRMVENRAMDAEVVQGLPEILGWEDVEFALRSKQFIMALDQPEFGGEYHGPNLDHTLVSLHGDAHFERRRIESVLFRSQALLRYEQLQVAPALAATLSALSASKGGDGLVRVDLLGITQRMFLGLMVALVGFDIDDAQALTRFEEQLALIDEGSRVRWTSRDPHEVVREAVAARRTLMDEFFWPAWKRREHLLSEVKAGKLEPNAVPSDLMTTMVKHRDHFEQWDPELVQREAALFIAASVGTTSTQICNVVADLEGWFQQHPEDIGRLPDDDDFLQRAIHETLRLHVIIPFVAFQAIEGVKLPSGLRIEAGQSVRINLVSANLDEARYGQDARAYNPLRTVAKGTDHYGKAFSDGPHTCIGKPLVLGGGPSGEGHREGTMKLILDSYFRAGVRLDPERPIVYNQTMVTGEAYAAFPAIFERLA